MLSQAEKDSPDSRIPDLTPNRDVAFEFQMLKLRTPHLEPQGELRLARSLSQMIGAHLTEWGATARDRAPRSPETIRLSELPMAKCEVS